MTFDQEKMISVLQHMDESQETERSLNVRPLGDDYFVANLSPERAEKLMCILTYMSPSLNHKCIITSELQI